MGDDAALLRRYATEDDDAAFRILVERNLPLVYSAALRQVGGDRLLAEDVTQSVFQDLARRAMQFDLDSLITPWLYRATHHAAATVVRGERRRRSRETAFAEELEVEQPSLPPGGEASEWDTAAVQLDAAVNALSEQDRDAILLRFFKGMDFRAVGEALRTSDDTAQKRVTRALEKLRLLLAQRGVALTGAALAAFLVERACAARPPLDLSNRIVQEVGVGTGAVATGSAAAPALTIPRWAIVTGGAAAVGVALMLTRGWDSLTARAGLQPIPGLVSRWTGEGHAQDDTGNNHGAVVGNVAYVPGMFGQAFHFDGQSNTHLSIPDHPSLNLTNEVTISLWFRADEDSDLGFLFAKRAPPSRRLINYGFNMTSPRSQPQWGIALVFNDTDVNGGYHLSERAAGTNYFVTRRNQIEQLAFFPGAEHSLGAMLGQWHHLAGTLRQLPDQTVEMTVYFDGANRGRRVVPGQLANTVSSYPLTLGGSVYNLTWFKGAMDEVQLYARALTDTEIQRLATPPATSVRHARK